MSLKKILTAAALGLAFAAPQAHATLFNFSYTAAVGVLSGVIDGALQADNNTVIVNSIQDFMTVNGAPTPSMSFVVSADNFYLSSGALPKLTLDGSFLDFVACDVVGCGSGNGFLLAKNNLISVIFAGGVPLYSGSAGIFSAIGGFEAFNAANYSLTAVPVPATLPLLAIGGAAMAFRRRKAG